MSTGWPTAIYNVRAEDGSDFLDLTGASDMAPSAASDDAQYITGVCLPVDGGITLRL